MKELCHCLQDPHLVARFQNICGVRGTFTTTSSSKVADRAHSHNNGACHHRVAGENLSNVGAGEGEKMQTASAKLRRRIADSNVANNFKDEGETPSQNGTAVSAATAGGERVGVGSSLAGPGVRSGSAQDLSRAANCEESQVGGVLGPPGSSKVKPLRKNSLTGDGGQEFLIDNRFLYYLFTFGTELGNETFYIIFFPFITWNVEAFVSRRLIMVWVWVMYLGQCTKDVLGWSRPASPPVVKVEVFYNSEYSMPSTHAMSGTAIPFALYFMTYGRWEVKSLFTHTNWMSRRWI